MSKDRLEEIISNEAYLEGTNDLVMVISTEDYKWLIKQAERVQELEEAAETDGSVFYSLEKMFMDLEEQNNRYRETIKKIKDYNRKALKVGNYTENEALLDISLEIRKLEGEE